MVEKSKAESKCEQIMDAVETDIDGYVVKSFNHMPR